MNNYINIDIKDAALFTHIVSIIDGNDILRKELFSLRKKWIGNKTVNDIKNWKSSLRFGEKINFNQEIFSLLKKHKLSVIYFSILEQAIVLAKITHFERVKSIAIPRNNLAKLSISSDDTMREGNYDYILITPLEATKTEVTQAFIDLKRKVKKLSKEDIQDVEILPPLPDTISNIERNRKWYWQHRPKDQGGERKSYFQIALSEVKGNKDKAWQYKDTIRKGIKQFEKVLLNVET